MKVADILQGTGADLLRTTDEGLVRGIRVPSDLEQPIEQITVDSRQVERGSIFFALEGERVDGHQFVRDALIRGSLGAVVERPGIDNHLPSDRTLFVVPDTEKALQSLAAYWRRKHDLDVVGVTGSLGKTTVKEAIAHVLTRLGKHRVLKSEGNLNTEIGLPLELLRLRSHHKAAVLEMGMYQLGDIKLLADIAQPNIGVVTNVHANHLERTGSIERTARGKAELVHALPPHGLAVLNGCDRFVRAMAPASRSPSCTFGMSRGCDFVVSSVRGQGRRGFAAEIRHGSRCMDLSCPTPGSHNAINLLPAVGVAHHLGIDWGAIQAGLNTFRLESRARFLDGPNSSLLLDDHYNASAASVIAAVNLMKEEKGHRHFALLGDMYELGAEEEQQHRLVGQAVFDLDGLVLMGSRVRWIAEEALARGLSPEKIVRVGDNEQAVEAAREILGPGDVMLIKGSRGLRLEEVVEELSRDKDVSDTEGLK